MKLRLALLLVVLVGCSAQVRRFPLKEPMTRDTDLEPVALPCHPDPKKPGHAICTPEPYESSFAWDGADNLVFRPIARLFAVDPAGESINVNSVDETPDSSWFTNRIGKGAMTVAELLSGPCGDDILRPETDADGSWVIDQGKTDGANPGFRIMSASGTRFMLKADPSDQPERATGATSIASRFYYAAGWWAPCDSVVYLRASLLKLKPGLKVTDNTGVTRPFDQAALDKVLANASRRGALVRMVASKWLPGRTIGPFSYEGTRKDDPHDVVAHEDRRDLRGARVLAAWLNHFDSREQNTMTTWMSANPKDADSSPGHVRHWYIDLGDCFGSEWEWEGISKRLGHAYYLDVPYLAEDFVTLGIIQRPWDRARRAPDAKLFGFFHSRDFEPDIWRGGYPNPAFGRMSEKDGAWAARIIARFTDEHVAAAVKVGDYTEPGHGAFLTDHLIKRRDAIVRRYFERLSPLADVRVSTDSLCAVDLARRSRIFPEAAFRYDATVASGASLDRRAAARPQPSVDGGVCVPLTHVAGDGGERDDAPERYLVVEVKNGQAKEPLTAHLYDLGPQKGFRLVGVER